MRWLLPPARWARPWASAASAALGRLAGGAAALTLGLGLAAGAILATPALAQDGSERPQLMQEPGTHSAPVRRIDVDSARGVAVTAGDDRTARVWNLASGELRHVLRPFAFGAEGGRLYGVAIHPREPLVAVAGTTGGAGQPHQIYLFDLDSGALHGTIDARAGDIRKLVWSADGSVLLASYNGTHGVRAFARDGRELLDDRFAGPVFGLAVGPAGQAVAVGLDGQLRSYRVADGAVARVASAALPVRRPAGVAFSPDGGRIAVAYASVVATPAAAPRGGPDSTTPEAAEVFDAATLRSLGRLPVPDMWDGDFRVIAWSADGATVAVGGTATSRDLRFPIALIDVAARRVVESMDVAGDSVTDLVALPEGGFAYTSFDGSWGVFAPGRPLRRIGAPVLAVRGNEPLDLELSGDGMAVRWATRTPGGGFGFAFERRRLALAPRDALRAPETRFDASNVPSDWNHGTRAPVVGGRPLSLAADERGRALAIARSFAQREDAAGNLSEASLSLTIAYQLCDPGRARSFSTNTTHTNVNFPGVDAGSCSTSGCHATVTKVGTIDYVASPRANPGSGNWYWCRRNDPTP